MYTKSASAPPTHEEPEKKFNLAGEAATIGGSGWAGGVIGRLTGGGKAEMVGADKQLKIYEKLLKFKDEVLMKEHNLLRPQGNQRQERSVLAALEKTPRYANNEASMLRAAREVERLTSKAQTIRAGRVINGVLAGLGLGAAAVAGHRVHHKSASAPSQLLKRIRAQLYLKGSKLPMDAKDKWIRQQNLGPTSMRQNGNFIKNDSYWKGVPVVPKGLNKMESFLVGQMNQVPPGTFNKMGHVKMASDLFKSLPDHPYGRPTRRPPQTPPPVQPLSPSPIGGGYQRVNGTKELHHPGIRNDRHPQFNQVQRHPLDRTPSQHEMSDAWQRWNNTHNEEVWGKPMGQGAVNNYHWDNYKGGLGSSIDENIPRIYNRNHIGDGGNTGFYAPNRQYNPNIQHPQTFETYAYPQPGNAEKDYFTYANRIRPENFQLNEEQEWMGDNAMPQSYGNNSESGMVNLSPFGAASPDVGVHEHEHIMQGPPIGAPPELNHHGLYETPAVLAEAGAQARSIRRQGDQWRSQGNEGLSPAEQSTYRIGPEFKGMNAHSMARQAAYHMYGEDSITGERVRPARTVTDLLGTPEGAQYLRMMNRKNPDNPILLDRDLHPEARFPSHYNEQGDFDRSLFDDSREATVKSGHIKAAYMGLHRSRNKHEELRTLPYDELFNDRHAGNFTEEEAKEYVRYRKKFEYDLRRRLRKAGIEAEKNNTFLYATLDGHEKMTPYGYEHRFPMDEETIESSFFDVVGDGKARTVRGKKGLEAAIKRWEAAGDNLETTQYKGMDIKPRIEVIMNKGVKPSTITKGSAFHYEHRSRDIEQLDSRSSRIVDGAWRYALLKTPKKT